MSNDRLDKNFAGPWFEPEGIAAKPPRAPCMADVVAENARLRADRGELLAALREVLTVAGDARGKSDAEVARLAHAWGLLRRIDGSPSGGEK